MDVTITVCTFGGPSWIDLAEERAIPSAEAQGVPVIHRHRRTLHEARNAALAQVKTEFVAVLDADDQLSPGYIDAMATGTADVRAPAVSYVRNGNGHPPYVPKVSGHTHDCTAECVASGAGNWIVVGAVVRTDLVRQAGGWRDWPMYEDFCLWLRVARLGASFEAIPAAVYRAWVRPDSRNRGPSMAEKNRVHYEIVAAAMPAAA